MSLSEFQHDVFMSMLTELKLIFPDFNEDRTDAMLVDRQHIYKIHKFMQKCMSSHKEWLI